MLCFVFRSLAAEWGKYGMRFNAIAPGPIETKVLAIVILLDISCASLTMQHHHVGLLLNIHTKAHSNVFDF